LCGALASGKTDIRMAAAAALGRTGDARALEPLNAALLRCYVGQSPARWLIQTLLVVGIVVVGMATFGNAGPLDLARLAVAVAIPLLTIFWSATAATAAARSGS
jgi:HEAT repeat protein